MFFSEITWLDLDVINSTHTLTGFDTLFGVKGSGIYGNPFTLVMFLFPIAILAGSTLLLFLNQHMYTVIFVAGIIGFILSIVYFITTLSVMNNKESIFDFTFYEMKTGLSWGVFPILGTYILITVLAFLCKRACEN